MAGARSLARQYANEEWRQARQSEQRLGLSLGLLTRVPPPRRAFYIGDTLRLDAGQHFLQMVPDAEDLGLEAAAEFEFDRLVRDALGLNVHLFPIQAEGMTPGPARTTQAEDTLISLGAETGGEGFIRGIPTSKIVARVHERYDCTYVLSFKPNGLPTDKIIAVHVGMVRKGVKVRSQGRVVIPSASQRKMTRILAAFAETGDDDPSSGFAVSLVFLSVEKRNYRALVQVRAPADPPGGTGWDLGASLIGRDSVRVDFSLHIAAAGRSVPVVLEKEVTLDPGAYEVVAVGQASGDRVLSSRIEGVLPKPDKDGFISPIAALQETTAAFSRDKITRISGPLVVPENEPVDDTKSIALVSVVCRDLGSSEEVIERKLAGDSPIRFDPVHFAPAERCVQLRDVIPANALTAGLFTYEIQLMRGEGVIQTGIHRIRVEPTSPPPPNRG